MVLTNALSGAVDVLESRLQSLRANPGSHRNEFHQMDTGSSSDVCTTACKPENAKRNRYTDVLPFERTRVVVDNGPGGNDYINASFIYSDRTDVPSWCFISAQGPLESTCEDYWRMAVQNQVPAIVMLTRLQEGSRVKCFRYYPENAGEQIAFGQMVVTCKVKQEPEAELQMRILEILDRNSNVAHTVHHFMFLGWPDHGVPLNTRPIRTLCDILQNSFKSRYPPLVHCSAGIGRSGTFIVLDVLMRRLRYLLDETLPNDQEVIDAVDIQKLVAHLRTQRMGMVQTEEQYAFCYQAAIDLVKERLVEKKAKS